MTASTISPGANAISPDTRVADLAVRNPDVTRIFENAGIDYCCGGRKTLQQASETAGVPLEALVASLDAAMRRPAEGRDWAQAPLTHLVAHILDTHHVYIRTEGPRIEALLRKVVERHGDSRPELRQLNEVFAAMQQELSLHLLKEEQILFPLVERMEEDGDVPASISCPVQRMMMEHDGAGEALAEIRRLTSDLTLPEGACTTFQVLYQALAAWEADLHQHIHLENNILFPKALALQDASLWTSR